MVLFSAVRRLIDKYKAQVNCISGPPRLYGQPARYGSLGNMHELSQISMCTDCNISHSACILFPVSTAKISLGRRILHWSTGEFSNVHQEQCPTKNDVFHQNCLALVSSFSLNQNFLFLYPLIGHFQVNFISAQVFFLLCMCAKRTLTKESFRPLPVSMSSICSTSCNNSSFNGEDGRGPTTEQGLKIYSFPITVLSFLIPVFFTAFVV